MSNVQTPVPDGSMGDTSGVLRATLEDVALTAWQVLGADTVDLYEYFSDRSEFTLPPIMLGERLVPGVVPRVIRSDDVVVKIVRDGLEIFASDARREQGLTDVWEHERDDLPEQRFVIREQIASTAAAAIRVGPEVVGVLFVGYREPRDFDGDSELRERVKSFARFAGTAIQSARLLEREEVLRRRADALAKVASVINQSEALDEIAGQLLDTIGSVVPYVKASFHLVNGGQRILVAGRGFDPSQSDEFLSRSISDDRLISRVMSQREPLVLSSCRQDPDWEEHPDTEDVESWIGFRVSSATENLGLVTIDHDVAGFYRPELIPLLIAFANQAATAIEKSRFVEETRARSERFERLQKVAQAIAAKTSDLRSMLQLVVDELATMYPNASCFVRLYDPRADLFESQVATGVLMDMLPTQPEVGGTSRHVIRTGKPRFLSGHELGDPPDRGPSVKKAVLERGVKATAYLPLKVEGEAQGVLYLDLLAPHIFSEADREFLELFSDQAAIAIRNARLLERQRREREERIRAIREIGFEISTDVTRQEVLDNLLDNTLKVFGKASQGQICLVDESRTKLRVVAVRGDEADHIEELDIGQGIAGWVASTGQSRVVPDVSQVSDYVSHLASTEAEIAVPLLKGGTDPKHVVGVLNIEHPEKGAFSNEDIPLLEAIATHAVVALDNATLFEELTLRTQRLEQIQHISLDLSGEETDLNEIMKIAVQGLAHVFKGSSCSIRLRDPKSGEYGRLVATGPLKGRGGKPRSKQGTSAWVMSSLQPLYIEDTADTAATRRDGKPTIKQRVRDHGVRAIAYLPLISQGQALGMLYLNLYQPHRFAHDERKLLELYAGQVAAAIDNANLIQHITQDLHTSIEQLEVLTRIYEKIIEAGIDNLDRILDIVYEETSRIIDVSDALFYIALYDQETDQISFGLAIEKNDGKTLQEIRWGKSEGREIPAWMPRYRAEPPRLTEYVINQKRSVLIPSSFAHRARKQGIKFWPKIGRLGRPTHCWLGVPMMLKGQVTGVISIQNLEREHALDADHERLLARLAVEAAAALDSAQLYKIAREDAIASKQLATLGTATAALQHRINNSFSIIIPNVTRLRKRVDTSDAIIEEILDLIERNARATAKMIDRIHVPLRESEAQKVDINAVVNEVVETFKATEPTVAFERELLHNLPRVIAPSVQVTEVVTNLIENSCRAMDGKGLIRASTTCVDGTIQVRIEDTGPGIPAEARQRLFVRPVASRGAEHGSGLGLWLSRLILQSLSGDIRIERTDPSGTIMLVEIPVKE